MINKDNHLLTSMYLATWREMSYLELLETKNIIQTKINSIQDSKTVVQSLTEIMNLLDIHITERILDKK